MSSANSASMSKFGRVGDNLFADDGSFEQQFVDPEERFDVVAPAGKLGMVIDTPNGGVPVVHAIKETSVLADQVRVHWYDCHASVQTHQLKIRKTSTGLDLLSIKFQPESSAIGFFELVSSTQAGITLKQT
jgi:hypothetical protein